MLISMSLDMNKIILDQIFMDKNCREMSLVENYTTIYCTMYNVQQCKTHWKNPPRVSIFNITIAHLLEHFKLN